MQIPQKFPQFVDSEALIIVAGKTIGSIYRMKDGEIELLETLEKQLESLSDDEGFFFGGSNGAGGYPKERNDEDEYIKQLRKNIATELDQLIARESTGVLYVFEPEHLKGRIVDKLQEHPQLTVHVVDYGNYHDEPLMELLERIAQFIKKNSIQTDVDFDKDLQRYS
ncbi:MAG TPA: hypothetical protein VKP88_06830 [Candidatus Paceibacterota bacterium]|nr:hypothetical protein [Candidatus Paceibacterota bacterium]